MESIRSLSARGLLALVLGLLMLAAPFITAAAIGVFAVLSIGAWLIVDGIASCVLAGKGNRRDRRGWGWTLAGGVAAVLSGALILIFPLTVVAAGGLLTLWMLATGLIWRGVFEIGDRRLGGWVAASGLFNVFFGLFIFVMLLLNPAAVLASMLWVVAVYGIGYGLFSLVLAARVRRVRH